MQPDHLEDNKGTVAHDAGIWFQEPCEEIALLSDQYDFAISLLHFDDATTRCDLTEEEEEDSYDHMRRRMFGSSWRE